MRELVEKLNWKLGVFILFTFFVLFVLVAQLFFQPASSASWQQYKGSQYTLSYPTDWSIAQQVENDVAIITLENGQTGGRIIVQGVKNTLTSLTQSKKLYEELYVQKSIQIDGEEAQDFQGSMKLPSGKLQEHAVIFEYNGTIYLIKLSYKGDNVNNELEKTFTQFLSKIDLQ